MKTTDPTFKRIFGLAWDNLSPIFHKRYGNRPFSSDRFTFEGKMDIYVSKWMSFIAPLFSLLHLLTPRQGSNIFVSVDFRSQENNDAVYLDRKFYFSMKNPHIFNSAMSITNDNEVIERMALGLGWKTHYFYDGKKVIMQHKGFVLSLLGYTLPLPIECLIGKGYAEEEAIDDNSYRMLMTITHPWLGLLYSYRGDFYFKGHS